MIDLLKEKGREVGTLVFDGFHLRKVPGETETEIRALIAGIYGPGIYGYLWTRYLWVPV